MRVPNSELLTWLLLLFGIESLLFAFLSLFSCAVSLALFSPIAVLLFIHSCVPILTHFVVLDTVVPGDQRVSLFLPAAR